MSLEYLTSTEGVVDYVLLNIAGEAAYLYLTAATPTSISKTLNFISTSGAVTSLGSDSYDKICAVNLNNQIFRIFWNVPNSVIINYRDFNFLTLSLGSTTSISITGQDTFVKKFNNTYLMTYILNQNLLLARSFDAANWEFVQALSADSRFSIRRAEFNLTRRSNGFDLQSAEIRELRSGRVSAVASASVLLSTRANGVIL